MKYALALLTVLASGVLAERAVIYGQCNQPSNKCRLRFPRYNAGGGLRFAFVDWPCDTECTQHDGRCSYATDSGLITCDR
ncbi:hypothetical protein VFPFJ_07595 [Purpureocillium lilacinum]|uniref:Uncharacterized protein n=2 Tax=Purpureocillium lilacinum TaxID=33203 RepID=A0ACC4DPK8_PURLI|nr:hypothetical protein VFPFJ_07595 [Purpureocillium lilacinum]OAQ85206.1 hypothetical protein VFPFJ_07595 [Purpureocillium lilacinum]GJN74761.1 hypothetical protein PLICBS_008854 [Purpureocillium lilacinum]GJN86234.1 hypothetical protein PLIIFM63780_009813 [Purpureocillium lilacinum]